MESIVPDELSESLYEDPDALSPVSLGSRPDVQVRPKPHPRTKSEPKPKVYNNVNSSSISGSSNQKANTVKEALRHFQSMQHPHYMNPHPGQPSPFPPVTQNVYPTPEVPGQSHYRRSISQSSAEPRTLSVGKKSPPKPPDRPPTSSPHYDRPATAMGFTPASSRRSSISSSRASLVSEVLLENGPISPGAHRPQAMHGRSRSRYSSSSQQSSSSVSRSNSVISVSNSEIRPSPPSFRPPLPPLSHSGSNYYNDREYLQIISDEADGMSLSGSANLSGGIYQYYQYEPNSIYQLTTDDIPRLLQWLEIVSRDPDAMSPSLYGLSIQEELRAFAKTAMNVQKAHRLYNLLMMEHKEALQNGIKDFQSICDKLDKVKKKNKNMGIAGGTTGAVGGAVAVAGVAFAPMTMGISLIATAIGAGTVALAGGLGVHTAKKSKNAVRRTNVEAMVNNYKSGVVDLELCLAFILPAMNELRRYDIARLQQAGAHPEALRMARLSQSVLRSSVNNSRAMSLTHPGGGTSTCLLKAFTSEMDQYFTEDHGEKLKKSNKSKFGGIVSTLTKNLKEELDYLIKIWQRLN